MKIYDIEEDGFVGSMNKILSTNVLTDSEKLDRIKVLVDYFDNVLIEQLEDIILQL